MLFIDVLENCDERLENCVADEVLVHFVLGRVGRTRLSEMPVDSAMTILPFVGEQQCVKKSKLENASIALLVLSTIKANPHSALSTGI